MAQIWVQKANCFPHFQVYRESEEVSQDRFQMLTTKVIDAVGNNQYLFMVCKNNTIAFAVRKKNTMVIDA